MYFSCSITVIILLKYRYQQKKWHRYISTMKHELVIGNTWFRKKDINKYTWIRINDGRMVDRALMDYVIVNKNARGMLLDVHVLRGAAGGMSDNFLVEGRVKVSY